MWTFRVKFGSSELKLAPERSLRNALAVIRGQRAYVSCLKAGNRSKKKREKGTAIFLMKI